MYVCMLYIIQIVTAYWYNISIYRNRANARTAYMLYFHQAHANVSDITMLSFNIANCV